MCSVASSNWLRAVVITRRAVLAGYEGTSLEFDPALPKELRVADATLRRRRREAIRAGHLNDFNPGVIGTTEASRDPSVIRCVRVSRRMLLLAVSRRYGVT